MPTFAFVTNNPHKVQDAQKLLTRVQLEHLAADIGEIQSLDPKEIIEHKLKQAFTQTNKPCFVMDTSFYLDCLNGFPGPLIKWFFKQVGDQKICQICSLFNNYNCHYTTYLGYFDGQETYFFSKTIHGSIAPEPRGANGFDWDTIFIPQGQQLTFAEMSFTEKQQFAVTSTLLRELEEFILAQTNQE